MWSKKGKGMATLVVIEEAVLMTVGLPDQWPPSGPPSRHHRHKKNPK